jgi:hypothetical protein
LKAYAISDGETIIERSDTGQMCVYSDLERAKAVLAVIKRAFTKSERKDLRVCTVEIPPPESL